MKPKVRQIEVDGGTADLLEARAAALGMSVSALLAEIAGNESILPPGLARLRAKKRGALVRASSGGGRAEISRVRTDSYGRALG